MHKTKIKIIAFFVFIILCCLLKIVEKNKVEVDLLSPIPADYFVRAVEIEEPEKIKIVKIGKVSFYSSSGCLGCGKNQITASGEKFDENAMTLAIPAQWRKQIPMKTPVRVTNLDNGKSVIARVNDTGGFLKYNRIADLSLGLCKEIDCKTNVSTIKIEVLE